MKPAYSKLLPFAATRATWRPAGHRLALVSGPTAAGKLLDGTRAAHYVGAAEGIDRNTVSAVVPPPPRKPLYTRLEPSRLTGRRWRPRHRCDLYPDQMLFLGKALDQIKPVT